MRGEADPNDFYRELGRWLLTSAGVVPLGLVFMAHSGFGVLLFVMMFDPFVGALGGAIVGACLGWMVGVVHERWVRRSILIWAIIGFALGPLHAIYGDLSW